eukprot:CFRG3753T1
MDEPCLKVSQRIITRGGHTGTIRFIGTTNFAKGKWVGVELDVPEGKNDGSVEGVSYFVCPSNHGSFVRATAIQPYQDGESELSTANVPPPVHMRQSSHLPRPQTPTKIPTPSAHISVTPRVSSGLGATSRRNHRNTPGSIGISTTDRRSSSSGDQKIVSVVPQNVQAIDKCGHVDMDDTEISRLRDRIAFMEHQKAIDHKEHERTRIALEQMNEYKQSWAIKQAQMSAQLRDAEHATKNVEERLTKMELEVQEANDGMENALLDKEMAEENLEISQAETAALKDELEALRLDYEIIKEEANTVVTANDGSGSISALQIKQFEAQIERYKGAIMHLRDMTDGEKCELNKTIASLEKRNSCLALYESKCSDLEATVLEQEALIDELKLSVDECAGAVEMVESLTETQLDLEENIRDYRDAIAEFETLIAVNDEMEAHHTELQTQLSTELDFAQAEASERTRELAMATQRVAEYARMVDRLKDIVSDQQAQLQSAGQDGRMIVDRTAEEIASMQSLALTQIQIQQEQQRSMANVVGTELLKLDLALALRKTDLVHCFVPQAWCKGGNATIMQGIDLLLLMDRLLSKSRMLITILSDHHSLDTYIQPKAHSRTHKNPNLTQPQSPETMFTASRAILRVQEYAVALEAFRVRLEDCEGASICLLKEHTVDVGGGVVMGIDIRTPSPDSERDSGAVEIEDVNAGGHIVGEGTYDTLVRTNFALYTFVQGQLSALERIDHKQSAHIYIHGNDDSVNEGARVREEIENVHLAIQNVKQYLNTHADIASVLVAVGTEIGNSTLTRVEVCEGVQREIMKIETLYMQFDALMSVERTDSMGDTEMEDVASAATPLEMDAITALTHLYVDCEGDLKRFLDIMPTNTYTSTSTTTQSYASTHSRAHAQQYQHIPSSLVSNAHVLQEEYVELAGLREGMSTLSEHVGELQAALSEKRAELDTEEMRTEALKRRLQEQETKMLLPAKHQSSPGGGAESALIEELNRSVTVLQEDLRKVESENRSLKQKVKAVSRGSTPRQGGGSPTVRTDRRTPQTTPLQTSSSPRTPIVPSGPTTMVDETYVEVLTQAIDDLRQSNAYLRRQLAKQVLDTLPPLRLNTLTPVKSRANVVQLQRFKQLQSGLTRQGEFRNVRNECSSMLKRVRETCAKATVVDISARYTLSDNVDMVTNNKSARQLIAEERLKVLDITKDWNRMTSNASTKLAGLDTTTSFNTFKNFPRPAVLKALAETSTNDSSHLLCRLRPNGMDSNAITSAVTVNHNQWKAIHEVFAMVCSGGVYCHTRDGCEDLAWCLSSAGFRARAYHAGLTPKERKSTQHDWLES